MPQSRTTQSCKIGNAGGYTSRSCLALVWLGLFLFDRFLGGVWVASSKVIDNFNTLD